MDFDQTTKADHSKTIGTLRHYVLIWRDRVRVVCLTRDGDKWLTAAWTSLDALLHLEAIGCEVPLASLYAGVELPEPGPFRPSVGTDV